MVGLQPVIIRAGFFDSSVVHRGWSDSPPRVLGTFEIAMFVKDGGTAWLNGREYLLREGHILFGRPGDVRWNKLHFQCQTIHFSTDEPILLQMLDTLPQYFKPQDPEMTLEMFKAVQTAFETTSAFSAVAASGRICELLWQLHLHNAVEAAPISRRSVRKAVRLIQRKYDEQLTVERMAKVCGLSLSHFHKLFVESTGTSPNRYLILTRLTAAKNMLATGNQSVAQVAESCGFGSQAYFCQCMKKFTGMSPKGYFRPVNRPEDI